jgi:hypothetical protein
MAALPTSLQPPSLESQKLSAPLAPSLFGPTQLTLLLSTKPSSTAPLSFSFTPSTPPQFGEKTEGDYPTSTQAFVWRRNYRILGIRGVGVYAMNLMAQPAETATPTFSFLKVAAPPPVESIRLHAPEKSLVSILGFNRYCLIH